MKFVVKSRQFSAIFGCSTALLAGSAAHAEAATSPAPTVSDFWWVPLGAALIGACAALATPVLKNLIVDRRNEADTRIRNHEEVLRKYLAPLADVSASLMWRFREIFVDGRAHWLKSNTFPLQYNDYKRKSTVYRMACLLGWLRAIELELDSLPLGRAGIATPILAAINTIRSAWADGSHVELHRLQQVASVWGLNIDALETSERRKLATSFEVKLYSVLASPDKPDSSEMSRLPDDVKLKICDELANFLCTSLRRQKLEEGVIRETVNRTIGCLSYREALIYRDWQDAIGDAVLVEDKSSSRLYKPKGFKEFLELLADDKSPPWLHALNNSILDIDFELVGSNDFRSGQLGSLAKATANLLISLAEAKATRSSIERAAFVDESVVTAARELLATLSNNAST